MIHRHPVRVYYEDTDMAGIVYYANYLKFLERGRSEAVRAAGIDQRALREDRGLVFAVRHVSVDYLRPARFDDELVVLTGTQPLRGATLEMPQSVWRGETQLIQADIKVVLMTVDGKIQRFPADIRERLESLRG